MSCYPTTISEYDATRHKDCQPELSVTFKLNENGQAKLSGIKGAEDITEWTLTKNSDGDFTVDIDTTLNHDLQRRRDAIDSLEKIEGIDLLSDKGSRKKQRRRSNRIREFTRSFQK